MFWVRLAASSNHEDPLTHEIVSSFRRVEVVYGTIDSVLEIIARSQSWWFVSVQRGFFFVLVVFTIHLRGAFVV